MKFVKQMTSDIDNYGVAEGFLIVPGQGLKCIVSGLEKLTQNITDFLGGLEFNKR